MDYLQKHLGKELWNIFRQGAERGGREVMSWAVITDTKLIIALNEITG